MDDIVVVSNRQPYRHHYEDGADEKEIAVDRPVGGLTAGLDPVMQRLGGTWIAWGDGDADREATNEDGEVSVPPGDPKYELQRLWLSDEEVDGYYEGYSNQALWPLCHSLPDKARFDGEHWRTYRDVNGAFADAVVEEASEGAVIWFHDYHFGLAPRMVARELPEEACLMQFWHIPWPAPDVFRVCPQQEALLRGLLGNDLLGFHVPRYCVNFLMSAEELLDEAVVDWTDKRVHHAEGATTVRSFPMGVDADGIQDLSREADGSAARSFEREHGIDPDTSLVLGVDRMDYTKGIPQRLEALERLWEAKPEWRGEFTYVQKGSESRTGIPVYREFQMEVRETVDRLNRRFGTADWQPVVYTTEVLPREDLCALYRRADVALVSPLRDGMNLVAQEYVASQVGNEGVLVLSEFAGVHDRLGESALSVNPYDTESLADAVEEALTMDPEERASRMNALRRRVHDGDTDDWIEDVLSTVSTVEAARANR